MEIVLADFAELCNKCLDDISEQSPELDGDAKKLGNEMLDKMFQDKDDEKFLRSLERRAYTSGSMQYVFCKMKKSLQILHCLAHLLIWVKPIKENKY